MGCENSRAKHLGKLKEMSKGTLDDRKIEEIIMNTYCKSLDKISNLTLSYN